MIATLIANAEGLTHAELFLYASAMSDNELRDCLTQCRLPHAHIANHTSLAWAITELQLTGSTTPGTTALAIQSGKLDIF